MPGPRPVLPGAGKEEHHAADEQLGRPGARRDSAQRTHFDISLHTLFGRVGELKIGLLHVPLPEWATVDWGAVFITLAALFIYFGLKWDMLKTIGVCVVLGLGVKFLV